MIATGIATGIKSWVRTLIRQLIIIPTDSHMISNFEIQLGRQQKSFGHFDPT